MASRQGNRQEPLQANGIVLTAAAQPEATLLHTVGSLFPAPFTRGIFAGRIVQSLAAIGFTIDPLQIPLDYGTTLQDVIGFIVANAISTEPQSERYYCSRDDKHNVSRADHFCPKCGALVIKQDATS